MHYTDNIISISSTEDQTNTGLQMPINLITTREWLINTTEVQAPGQMMKFSCITWTRINKGTFQTTENKLLSLSLSTPKSKQEAQS